LKQVRRITGRTNVEVHVCEWRYSSRDREEEGRRR
jgi:hypothetical protein